MEVLCFVEFGVLCVWCMVYWFGFVYGFFDMGFLWVYVFFLFVCFVLAFLPFLFVNMTFFPPDWKAEILM